MKFKMNDHEWEILEMSNDEINKRINDDSGEYVYGSTEYSGMIIYLNKDIKNKRSTLYHELCHCFLYEYGHNQWKSKFNYEDVCEIVGSSHDIIHKISDDYFKDSGK